MGKLLAVIIGLLAGNARADAPTRVASLDELERAIRGLGSGVTILLADGVYTTARLIRIEGKRGTPEAPMVIRAEHRGQAEIAGAAGFVIARCAHLVLEGFVLTHDADKPAVLLDDCQYVRVARNSFRLHERAQPRHMEHWLYAVGARSEHNRVDHNFFGRKVNSGSHVFVRGDDAALVCSQHDRIDHNHFRDVVDAGGENGHETIRTGSNDLGATGRSSFTVIEQNLLERCSGEGEIVSLKSSDNIVRDNTLVNCRGAICLRLGNNNTVSGNFVLTTDGGPNRGGVKLYGFDHRVFNNYFLGLTGTGHEAPLALIPGTLDMPTTDNYGKKYDSLTSVPATRARVAFNTWIDCAPLQFGLKKDKVRTHVPSECTFVNNMVVRTGTASSPLVNLGLTRELHARGNLGYHGGGTPQDGAARWFLWEEPRLRRVEGSPGPGLWRLTESSPAVDAAVQDTLAIEIDDDVFGRARSGPKDIGAEEFSIETLRRRPLTPTDVGPDAP
jgi:poly(beta-D-mannuronate) lyase